NGAWGCSLVVSAWLGRGPCLVGLGLLRVRRINGEGIVWMQLRIGGRVRHVTLGSIFVRSGRLRGNRGGGLGAVRIVRIRSLAHGSFFTGAAGPERTTARAMAPE